MDVSPVDLPVVTVSVSPGTERFVEAAASQAGLTIEFRGSMLIEDASPPAHFSFDITAMVQYVAHSAGDALIALAAAEALRRINVAAKSALAKTRESGAIAAA